MRFRAVCFCALISVSAAFAHQGVQNAAVMARMEGMSAIAEKLKLIGKMSKGATTFDRVAAQEAVAAIARHASEIRPLFEPNESDPKSEAKAAIWEQFDDFSEKASDLEAVATRIAGSLDDEADLKAAMVDLGKSCKACHSIYKE